MTPGTASELDVPTLPEALRPLFWEHDFDALRWTDDRDLLFERILAAGPWETVRWLWRCVGDEALEDWLRKRRGRPLSRRQLRFWQLMLGIPGDEVDCWLAERAPDIWGRRCRG